MRDKSGNYEAVDQCVQMEVLQSNQCLTELKSVLQDKELLVPGSGELDQSDVRELLNKKIDSEKWKEVLQELLKEGSYFMLTGSFEQEEDRRDLKRFLENLLFACVEDDLEEHLKTTIDWLKDWPYHLTTILKPPHGDEEGKQKEKKEEKSFYENNVVMKRACKKRDISTVFVLFKAGFRLKTRLEVENVLILSDVDQLMAEISIFKARASPAYLLTETKQPLQQEPINFQDPISKAMELIKICDTLAETRRGAIKKVENIRKVLEKFLVKMLDLCRPGQTLSECEVGLFLSQG